MDSIKILFDLIKENQFQDFITELEDLSLKEGSNLDLNLRDETGNYLISYAVLKNNYEICQKLIEKGSRIDINDQDGRTLIYIPIKYYYNNLLKLFLKYDETTIGISIVNVKDRFKNIPLHYSIIYKNLFAIKLLLEYNSNPNTIDNDNNNSLFLAIMTRNQDIFNLIIESNIEINHVNQYGENALHIACGYQLYNMVEGLLRKKININQQEYDNEVTPLIYSVNLNNTKISLLLLKNNADPNIQDFMGNTALHYAIIEENNELIFYLLKENIIETNLNVANTNNKLPIHLYLEKKSNFYNQNILEILIKRSNLNYQDKDGNSALHYLCKNDYWKEFRNILEKKKMNITLKNKKNESPFDYINNNEKKEFLKLITSSYLFLLRNTNFVWENDWENACVTEKRKNNINDEDFKILNKYVNIDKIQTEKDICEVIVEKKIKNIINISSKNINDCIKSYPIKINKQCIKISESEKVNFCSYVGITLDILVGLIYLLNKFKNACTTISNNFIYNKDLCDYYASIGVKTNYKCEFLNFEIIWIFKRLFFSSDFENNFKKCVQNKKKRFIIIPLGIELEIGSHANYLIFDKKLNEIERFEPYGAKSPSKFDYDPQLLDNYLKIKFQEINEKINFIPPENYIPKISFQYLEIFEQKTKNLGDPGGFCAVWSVWYTEMRMTYPDIDRKQLVKMLLREIRIENISFKNLIRNYSKNITDIRDNIFNKIGLNINDWLNDQVSEKQYDSILDELKKLFLTE